MSGDNLRLLHILTSLRAGGAEQLVAELLPRLQARGHRAELLLFDGTRTPLCDRLEAQGIRIHTLGRGAWQMWNPLHAFRLKKYLDRERFDLVHTHNTPCQLLTAWAAPKTAPRLVTTEHNTCNRRRGWRWFRGIDRWMYGRYDRIVCVGSATKANLANRLGGRAGAAALAVIPNGIDLARFREAVPAQALRLPAETDKKIVVMVAAFRAQKDQPTLIRAMRHLPEDYRLWLVGEGPRRAACERLAEASGLSGRVRFWGVRADVPALLAASDAVVLSSHYEGLSLASIEGMASGRPFIASDVEGLREAVDGAGLLFPPGDHEQLASLIRRVCEDETCGSDVAARGRARSMEYDIGRVVCRYERLYREMLEQKTLCQ